MKIPSEVCLMTKRLLAGAQRLESLWNKPSVLGRFNKYHKSYHHQWALVNLSNLEGIFDDMTMLTPLLYKVLTQSFFRKVAVHWKLNISTTTQALVVRKNFLTVLNKVLCGKAPPGGVTPHSSILYYIPFLTEKVYLSYTFHWPVVRLSQT